MLHDLAGVLDDLTTQEVLVGVEVHPHQFARVEEPVVVVRQPNGVLPPDVARLLTGRVGVLGAEQAEAAVVGERQAHHANTREAAPFGGRLADHGQPVLEPPHVDRLAGDELPKGRVLVVRLVEVARLQAVGGVLEATEELAELSTDEPTQRSPSCSR